jgi:hypothetical protein
MDVSNRVDVTDAGAVGAAIRSLLEQRYPGECFARVEALVADLKRLYDGDYPGYHGCEVKYHDIQHVLDVSLAMARLVDGHERSASEAERLGPDRALLGICAALFHDAGYIRRRNDTRHRNGGAYTRVHVDRSARWLREYLPSVGLARLAEPCARLVQFTNCGRNPAALPIREPGERRLGELLGTADLIAQLADLQYIEKCRDFLYAEFVEGGIAGASAAEGYGATTYRSPEDLLASTPGFIRWVLRERLEQQFRGAYHYAREHFGGANPYMDAIRDNYTRLEARLHGRVRA